MNSAVQYGTSPPEKQVCTVTILDACHAIGRHVSLLLKQNSLITELRLHDRDAAVCCVAEDLSHIDTRTRIKSYCGNGVLKHAILDSDIVVCIGGPRTKLSETPRDLFEKNLDDVRSVALHCIEFNPKAVLCIAKPPVEAFVPLLSEEYKRAGVYDFRKIVGLSSIQCMRANYYTALVTGQDCSEVRCPIIGGVADDSVVAVVSAARPARVHSQHHKTIQDLLSKSERELVKSYRQNQIVCLASALAVSRFIDSLSKALNGASNCVECAFIRQTGHIGQFLPYMTSIVRLGRHGILSSHMPNISGYEAFCLKRGSLYVKDLIKLGESFVTGATARATFNCDK
ncbi:malate dehydrogenase, mitochondrial-like [Cylas formicarius]|uniref:malate dehydrogenase, mitochondrial-like n=1 Tax=Cylas formicarius TaxID=197179 RepID=UPI00295840B2|nr:malate dehydrogenase, mitochondrial-like [Cylas formicarius]